jgi:hypothetical protein
VRKVNIADPEFTYDDNDPDGFRAGMFRLGKLLDVEETGTSVYELPPGQAICPYHFGDPLHGSAPHDDGHPIGCPSTTPFSGLLLDRVAALLP